MSTDCQKDSNDTIVIIVNQFTKMVLYKPRKTMIDVAGLAKLIINVIVSHHGLPESMMSDSGSLYSFEFLSSLCYFFYITHKLFIVFYP